MYEYLEKLLIKHKISLYRLAKETDIPYSSLSDWKNGKTIPKNDKLQKISQYFNVSLSYLTTGVENKSNNKTHLDKETEEIAQTIYENKDLKELFDVAKNINPKRLKAYYEMIKELEDTENKE